jgi:O-antigen ligase
MSQWLVLVGLGVICFFLPNALLIPLGVAAVMVADTDLLPPKLIYFARFVPIGVLAWKSFMAFSRTRKKVVTRSVLLKAWAPFVILAAASVGYSAESWISAQRLLSGLFVFVGFGIGIPLFFSRAREMRHVIKLIGVLMAAAIVYSIFQLPQEGGHIVTPDGARGTGVFRNANTFGLLAMQGTFLLIFWWQTENRSMRKFLVLAGAIIVGTAVLLSGSRASILGLVVGLLVLTRANWSLGEGVVSNLLRVTAYVVVALLLVETFFPEYLGGLLRTETASRAILWNRAWVLAQHNFWLGVGFGASDSLFAHDALYLRSVGIHLSGPHSSLLRLLVDLGIVGVVTAALAFWRVLRHVWRQMGRFEDPRFGACLLGVVAASLVNSAFESWLFAFGNASTVPFWFFLALLSYQADAAKYRTVRIRWQQRLAFAAQRRRVESRLEAGAK